MDTSSFLLHRKKSRNLETLKWQIKFINSINHMYVVQHKNSTIKEEHKYHKVFYNINVFICNETNLLLTYSY